VGVALGVAQTGGGKTGGHLGSDAASGLMGRKGQMAARAMGLGKPEGQGGMSAKSVLGSGLLGAKV